MINESPLAYRLVDDGSGYRCNALRPTLLVPKPPLEVLSMSKSGWKYRLHIKGEAHVLHLPDPWLVLLTGDRLGDIITAERPVRVEYGGTVKLNAQWAVGTDGCTDFRWYIRPGTLEKFGPDVRPGVFPGAIRMHTDGDYESWLAM